jgi:hypothetical protein
MRKTIVIVMSIAAAAAAVVVAFTVSGNHHTPARPAGIVRTVAPAPPPTQPPAPSAAFDADTFLNLLTRVDAGIANGLIDTLSAADRAALATDVTNRVAAGIG